MSMKVWTALAEAEATLAVGRAVVSFGMDRWASISGATTTLRSHYIHEIQTRLEDLATEAGVM
jgi:hypothetical protein